MTGVDALQIHFDPAAQEALKWILALIMFGVALDLKTSDFQRIKQSPRTPMIGLICQFVFMPALAFSIVWLWQLAPSLALGMILVAACPGGNLSNFLTAFAAGNTAVSVTMSAISTLAAIVMTPLNFSFWGGMLPGAETVLTTVSIEPLNVLEKVVVILVIPSLLGMWFSRMYPHWALRLKAPMRVISMLIFLLFVIGGLLGNWDNFKDYIGFVFVLVFAVNAAGLTLGYVSTRLLGQGHYDAKAVGFETGIQNTGFGLILALEFFPTIGGIALVCAWWGIWHIASGLALAGYWRWQAGRFN